MTAGKRAQTAIAAANAAGTVTAAQVLDGHVTLDLECLDRAYLNGYVPNLQLQRLCHLTLAQAVGAPATRGPPPVNRAQPGGGGRPGAHPRPGRGHRCN